MFTMVFQQLSNLLFLSSVGDIHEMLYLYTKSLLCIISIFTRNSLKESLVIHIFNCSFLFSKFSCYFCLSSLPRGRTQNKREVTTLRWESEKINSSANQNYREVGRQGKKTKRIANLQQLRYFCVCVYVYKYLCVYMPCFFKADILKR